MESRSVPFLIKGPGFAAGRPGDAQLATFRRELFHDDARHLFDYWIDKVADGKIPGKAQIDPTEIPGLLPGLYIEEWDEAKGQSRLRLAGELHREVAGFNVQGLLVDEHTSGPTSELWKQCDQCNFSELRPTLCGYSLAHVEKPYKNLADLALPLRDGDGARLALGLIWPF